MGKMKHGTNVGLDKNYDNVCVGDTVRDDAGNEYIINTYGVAVDSAKGGTKKLSELKGIELVKSSETPRSREESPRGAARGGSAEAPEKCARGPHRPRHGYRAPLQGLDGYLREDGRASRY